MGTDQTTVVVTGLGATTPLGGDVGSTWEALLAGRSGARRLPDDWPADLPVCIAAPAAVDPATVLDRVQSRRLDRCEQFAIVAAREAWADAGQPEADPERIGVAVSSGIGGIASTIAAYDTMNTKGWQRMSPYTVPMLMPNGSAGWISIELGARAGVHTTVSACASGAESIAYAIEMIRSGRADIVMAGGTEAAIMPLNDRGVRRHARAVDPQRRAAAGLEAVRQGPGRLRARRGRGHARARVRRARGPARRAGARGGGRRRLHLRRAPHRPARPRRRGAGPGHANALADAGLSAGQVVHVNAHATSTPAGDIVEAQAIAAALGEASGGAVVTSTKSMTGHLLGGAGALESVAAILALREKVAPPTINLDDPDDEAGVDIATEPRPLQQRGGAPMAALNNSFGFGGSNVALAFAAA